MSKVMVDAAACNGRSYLSRRRHVVIQIALAFALISGCTESSKIDMDQQIMELMEADQRSFDLSSLDGPEWERLCILPPYTDDAGTRAITGIPWDSDGKTDIIGNDRISIFLLIRDSRVVAYDAVPKSLVDIRFTEPACYLRNNLAFVVSENHSGHLIYAHRDKQ